MARASPYQGDFSCGEISPLAYGRKDEPFYRKALAKELNMISTLQGGSTRRGGSVAVANAAANNYTRLIPFKISQTEAFLLEFGVSSGSGYMRVYYQRGQVKSGGSPYQISTPFSQTDIQTMKYAMTQLNNINVLYIATATKQPYKLIFTNSTSWTLQPVSFIDGPYANSFTPWGQTSSPAGVTGPQLFIQNAADYTAGTSFGGNSLQTAVTVAPITGAAGYANYNGQVEVFFNGSSVGVGYLNTGDVIKVSGFTGSYAGYNGYWPVSQVTPTSFVLTGSTFVSGSVTGSPLFLDVTWVKKNILAGPVSAFRFIDTVPNGTIFIYGTVAQIGNVGGDVFDFLVTVGSTGPSSLSLCGTYYTPGWGTNYAGSTIYPSAVNFHDGRLYWGGGNTPMIFGSYVNQFESMAPTEFAANSDTNNTTIDSATAISFSFASNENNFPMWISSDEKGLAVGTSGAPWIVKPSTLNEAITATNISAKPVASAPSANLNPVRVGKSTLYVESSFRRIRELAYFYDVDGYRSVDISEDAEHLSAPGISTELVYQSVPHPVIWCARNDGTLIGITYDRTLDNLRMAWHQHQLGGMSDNIGTPPIVESLCVIPSPDGTTDDVWMSVIRYINGTQFRSIEYLSKVFEDFNTQIQQFFVDYGTLIDNPVFITAMTNASSTVCTAASAHGLSVGQNVRFQYVNGMANAAFQPSIMNGNVYTVTAVSGLNFTINLNSSSLTPFIESADTVLGLPGGTVVRGMVTSITGLTQYANAAVDVFGDGFDFGTLTVSNSGVLTLPGQGAATVAVGFSYSSEIQQLRLEAGSTDGTSFGKLRRSNETAFMVHRSASFQYGVDNQQLYPVILREVSNPMDNAAPLFTGIKDRNYIEGDFSLNDQILVVQNRPLALTLLAIMPQVVTEDKG